MKRKNFLSKKVQRQINAIQNLNKDFAWATNELKRLKEIKKKTAEDHAYQKLLQDKLNKTRVVLANTFKKLPKDSLKSITIGD